MKNIFKIALISLLVLACGEKKHYTITTKVNRNGSCERTMVMVGDSSSYEDDLFKIFVDSTWTKDLSWEFDTSAEQYKCKVQVSKTYASVTDMNMEFSGEADSSKIRRPTHISLAKKFRWFYTYFHYQEVYPQQFKYKYFSINDYLTKEEISAYMWKETDSVYFLGMDSVQVKAEENRLDSLCELFVFDNLFEATKQSIISLLPPADVEKLKNDSISDYLKMYYIDGIFSESGNAFEEKFDSIFNPITYHSLQENNEKLFEQLEEIDFTGEGGDYSSNLQLPGKLINTNANNVDSAMVSWYIGEKNEYIDYPMWAKSRVVNYWAWVVAGIVLLIALVMLFVPSKKG